MEKEQYIPKGDSIVAYWPRPSSSNVLEGLKNDSLLPRERIVIDYLDRDSCVTHGYIYELLDGSGNTIGWLPMDTLTIKPTFEYTVLSRDTLAPVASVFDEENKLDIRLFPNPSSHSNTIRFNGVSEQHATIQLYDLQGRFIRPIYEGKLSDKQEITTNISDLSSGMYFYAILINQQKHTLKFVK